ncbi:hypothetical protein NQ318_002016 [Aromia moschata]|uniref:Ketosynthase family 3 (KS3) domain-containing protein n=1 Tax=Aromia moschata TaxID=1265417 RepID=A0AAV8Z3Z3_9CUCU|nr:hypothetical protein NQ318_002016 [Aromia moschata]
MDRSTDLQGEAENSSDEERLDTTQQRLHLSLSNWEGPYTLKNQRPGLPIQLFRSKPKVVHLERLAKYTGHNPPDWFSSKTTARLRQCGTNNFEEGKDICKRQSADSVLAHRITYLLQLKGPSVALDSACSSSLFALEHAYKSIQLGECDNAIVVGTNIILNQKGTIQFAMLGALSSVSRCKPFDKDSDGYVRSEGVCALLLQKAKVAKRIYARIVHCKTNNDGYKEEGITYPSRHSQRRLLREFYEECNVDPADVSYIEAHGTGTVVGDPEECAALDMIFGQKNNSSALVGSVKSNAGHCEAVSGLVSVIKCIIAMESEEIPPTIHFNEAGNAIPSIKEGRLEVVTNNKTLRDTKGLLAINSFGFGGANCHVLLKWHSKQKFDEGMPQDDLPRLVCISGRTREAVATFLSDISHMKLDYEYTGLLHEAFSKSTANHLYRGFMIVSKSGEVTRSLTSFNGNLPILCILFSRLQNWNIIIKNFLQVPLFYKSFKR